MKISKSSIEKFQYFSQCQDSARMPAIVEDPNGYCAFDCFHAKETNGQNLPCYQVELLGRALNGKARHGMTVTMLADDYVSRILFASEIKEKYPDWVQREIFARAKQIAQEKLGWIPGFIRTGEDFSTIKST